MLTEENIWTRTINKETTGTRTRTVSIQTNRKTTVRQDSATYRLMMFCDAVWRVESSDQLITSELAIS